MTLPPGLLKQVVGTRASYPLFERTYVFRTNMYSSSLLGNITSVVTGASDFLEVKDLDIQFNVKRTLTKEANSAEIILYNLSPDKRERFSGAKTSAVVLQAGYGGVNGIVFAGDVREINSIRKGTEWQTIFDAGDGLTKLKKKKISRSIRGPVELSAVLKTAAESLGFPLSRESEIILASPGLKMEYANKVFTHGVTLTGKADKTLDTLLESTGLEWSVQNGEMQITVRGNPISQTAIELTPETGLLESPEIGSDDVLSCKTLLIPDISPGKLIKIESEFITGTYRVQTATYRGYTAGSNWNIEIEAEAQ